MHLQASSVSVAGPGSCRRVLCCPHQPTAAALCRKAAASRVRVLTRYRPKQEDNSGSNSSSDEDAFRIPRVHSPAQLERAYQKTAQDMQLRADEFFTPHKGGSGQQPKVFVFVRHGHSTWNEQSRIQGNTDESELTALGRAQAVRARVALSDIPFDSCFSSPHTRARQTTEVVWPLWQQQQQEEEGTGLEEGPIYLPSLAEVDLGWFQGLRNADIARDHPDLYRVWREEPERFCLDGRYPVLDAFRQARRAWTDMLSYPGSTHLVVTHKSLLRAMLCTALGLPPRQFRAIDLSNGAVCMVRCNARGDLMLSALNLTSHLEYDNVRYGLPGSNSNDRLAAAAGLVTTAATVNVSSSSSSSSNGASVNYNQS